MPSPIGRPITEEQKRKMAEGRRRAAELRAKGKGERAPTQRPTWPDGLTKAKATALLCGAIQGADNLAVMVAPQVWVPGNPDIGDQLTEHEILILATALSAEAEKHPQAMRLLAQIMSYSERAGILGVLLLIVAPRLARRNMLPHWTVKIIRDMLRESEPPAPGEGRPEIPPRDEAPPDREAA